MSGMLTNGLPNLATFTGSEKFNVDTYASSGGIPQSSALEVYKMALMLYTMLNVLSKTPTAGTIYYTEINIGAVYDPTPNGSNINLNSYSVTGVNVPVGAVGGTDTLHVGVYNSSGVLVARSILAGVLLGTALTIQQVPLYDSTGATVGPVTLTSGTYYIAVQLSGNTGRFMAVNSPVWPKATGSQAGSSGTLAAITPATTYTQNVGPMASLY